jgi:uncharacterized protein YsxB (DUF464 family)
MVSLILLLAVERIEELQELREMFPHVEDKMLNSALEALGNVNGEANFLLLQKGRVSLLVI